jgi:hypothetical protein
MLASWWPKSARSAVTTPNATSHAASVTTTGASRCRVGNENTSSRLGARRP